LVLARVMHLFRHTPMEIEASRIVVVVEENAEWPGWLAVCSPLPSGSLVLVQDEAESLGDFVGRVTERCAMAGQFDLGIIACSERFDETARKSRAALARAVLGGTGRLFLTAGARSSGRCRHGLSALAADLTAEGAVAHHSVSVRFGSEHSVLPHSAA
jgi:hypothetical protein